MQIFNDFNVFRTYYLQSLLKDKKMKLFYETVSVPKLMRNLRNRMRKRRATSGRVDKNETEVSVTTLNVLLALILLEH